MVENKINCNPKKSYPCGSSCQSNSHGGACTIGFSEQVSTYFKVLKVNNMKAQITETRGNQNQIPAEENKTTETENQANEERKTETENQAKTTETENQANELVEERKTERDNNFETAKKFASGELSKEDIWGEKLNAPPVAFSKDKVRNEFNKKGHYNVYRNNFQSNPPTKEDGTSAVVIDQKETSIVIDDEDMKKNFPNPESQERIKRAEEILNRQGQVFSNDGKSNPSYVNKQGHQRKLAEEILMLEDKRNPLSILDKKTNEITPEDIAKYHQEVLRFNDFTDEEIGYIYSYFPRQARSKINSTGVPSENQGHYGGEEKIIPNKNYEQDDARGMTVLKRYLEQDGKDSYDGTPVHIYDVDYEHIIPGESSPNEAWSGKKYQRGNNLVGSDHPDNMVLIRGGKNKNRGADNLEEWRKSRTEEEERKEGESIEEWRERINAPYEEKLAAEAAGESPVAMQIKQGMAKRQNEILNASTFEEARRIATEQAIEEIGEEEAKKRKSEIKDYTQRFQMEGDIGVRPEIQELLGWESSKVSGSSTKYGLSRPNGRGSAGYPGTTVDKMMDLRYNVGPDAARIFAQEILQKHKDYFEDGDSNKFLGQTKQVLERYGMKENQVLKAMQTFTERAATTVKVSAGKEVLDNTISQEVTLTNKEGTKTVQRPNSDTLKTGHKERTDEQKKQVKDYVDGLVQEIYSTTEKADPVL